MISYQKVKRILGTPPPRGLIDVYNEIDSKLSNHPFCVAEDRPLRYLYEKDVNGNLIEKFCVTATSIQSKYIAFVLGKSADAEFPVDIIQLFFNVDNYYKIQFGKIKGKKIDGCICLIHQEDKKFDIQRVYDSIYNL